MRDSEQYELEGQPIIPEADAMHIDLPLEPLEEPYASSVRRKLVMALGDAVASWFEVVASGSIGTEVPLAAILLERHLPILIPVGETEPSNVFLISVYDVFGRRVTANPGSYGGMSKYHCLAEALVAADMGYRLLRHHAILTHSEQHYGIRIGDLPEERWLHEQLCNPTPGHP